MTPMRRTGRYVMLETEYSFQKAGSVQLLVDKIEASGMESHVIIYSSYNNQLATIKQLDPAITVWAKLLDSVPPVSDVQGFDGVMLAASLMTADNVAQLHAAGLTVIRQRTAESLANWNAFLATGADGLMTDSPSDDQEVPRAGLTRNCLTSVSWFCHGH